MKGVRIAVLVFVIVCVIVAAIVAADNDTDDRHHKSCCKKKHCGRRGPGCRCVKGEEDQTIDTLHDQRHHHHHHKCHCVCPPPPPPPPPTAAPTPPPTPRPTPPPTTTQAPTPTAPSAPACSDRQPVNTSTLPWPRNSTPPWVVINTTVAFTSASASQQLAAVLSGPAPDLNTSYFTVLELFHNGGCPMYLHGGSVRNMFLSLPPRDIDVEYLCDMRSFAVLCTNLYGPLCHFNNKSGYFYLGTNDTDEPFEGIWYGNSIVVPDYAHDFTVNELSYDANTSIFFDWPGTAVHDSCARVLRIPAPYSEWQQWLNESVVFPNNGYNKVPRFWKFSGAPYNLVPSAMTTSFVSNVTVSLWFKGIKRAFAVFLCKSIGGAVKSGTCYTSSQPPASKLAARVQYVGRVAVDVGQSFVKSKIMPLLAYKVNSVIRSAIPREPGW